MARPAAGNGEGKTDQLAAIESADGLAADFLADHEHAQRYHIHIVILPDFFLQRNAGVEFIHAFTFSDGDLPGLLFGPWDGGAQGLGSSSFLACCHRASISSRVASCRVRPLARNCSSSQPKRRRYFLLVLRK